MRTRLPDEPLCEVYEALSLELPVARRVKVLRPELMVDPVAQHAFLAPLEHAAGFSGARGLELPVEAGRLADGRPWVAYEHREGCTLAEHVAQHGLPGPAALTALLKGLAGALSSLHEAGAALGALAPERVLLEGGALAWPVLLGLEAAAFPGSPSHPRAGAAERSAAGDIHALGLLMMALMDAPPPSASGIPLLPDGYERLAPIVDRCLQEDPAERFESAGQLLAALGDEKTEPRREDDPFKDVFRDEVTTRSAPVEAPPRLARPLDDAPWAAQAPQLLQPKKKKSPSLVNEEAWFEQGEASL